MTDLVRQQLAGAGIMFSCGFAAGLIYHVFFQLRSLRAKSALTDAVLEVVSLILTGYCITVFLYYSSRGIVRVQDIVCFFAGLWLWRRIYGEKGEPAPGVRKEPQSAGHQHGPGRTEEKKEKSKKSRYRR